MANVLNNGNFDSEISNGVVVIDFFATWCGPCKMLAPVFDELSNEMNGKAKFFKVDIDESADLARKYFVSSVPTIMIFKDGKAVETMVGFIPKENLEAKIKAHL